MSRLPQVSGKDLGRALIRLGFVFTGQKGSHMKFTRLASGRKEIVVIPHHSVVRKGTLLGILKQLNVGVEQLKDLL